MQINLKNGTVQPASLSEEQQETRHLDGQRAKYAGQLGANMGSSKDDQIQP